VSEYRQAVAGMWMLWADLVAHLAPHLDRKGLYLAVAQVRVEPPAMICRC
jgi:hypothetical protein